MTHWSYSSYYFDADVLEPLSGQVESNAKLFKTQKLPFVYFWEITKNFLFFSYERSKLYSMLTDPIWPAPSGVQSLPMEVSLSALWDFLIAGGVLFFTGCIIHQNSVQIHSPPLKSFWISVSFIIYTFQLSDFYTVIYLRSSWAQEMTMVLQYLWFYH